MAQTARMLATAALLVLAGSPPLGAQQPQEAVLRGLDLERRGDQAGAAAAYETALAKRPGDLGALLGLERTLTELGRSGEVVPFARAALDGSSDSAAVHAMLVRGYVAAGESDSARIAAERWAAAVPGEEAPFRELGAALAVRRDRAGARSAFLLGRQRVGRASALAPELAQLSIVEGDFAGSVREWLLAIEEVPGYRLSAMAGLSAAPDRERAEILSQLERSPLGGARQLEAGLRARWGDPVAGYEVLSASLGVDRVRAAEALREYLELVRPIRTTGGRRAMGLTLEALADRLPELQAQRLRAEAAEAFAEAGDRAAARRVLARLASGEGGATAASTGAATTLIAVLVDEGKLEEAETRLAELEGNAGGDDVLDLRRRIARGYALRGELDRADSLIASDRSVEGMALAGSIALYRGDLGAARELLRGAGPFAGEREAATARAAMLALLQPIETESLPELGAALLALARGDTAEASAGLEQVADSLPLDAGGAELRLLGGRLAAAQGRHADAERLFRAAAGATSGAAAPAAGLELGRLLLSVGRRDEAVTTLEGVILNWPRSALVPQARRLLDEARGAIPRT